MSGPHDISLDAAIIGGGIAGLWILDELRGAGHRALLLEHTALGYGQTVASQGIIHGGLKYTLSGLLNPSAQAIRDMPEHWRQCLRGDRQPDLSPATVRARYCHLWRTHGLASRAAMIGASLGLRVAPVELPHDQRPAVLRDCPGTVARLDEQVIDPANVLAVLSARNTGRVLHTAGSDISFDRDCRLIRLTHPARTPLTIRYTNLILSAGAGNERLRERLALDPGVTQRRPLHQVLVRGQLPALNGHCVDGAATRVTITTAADSAGRRVWQLGGQLAERGVAMDAPALIAEARRELASCLPGIDLTATQWAAYRVDRAEKRSPSGTRPDDACVLHEGHVITAWPTKLALAPRLAELVLRCLPEPGDGSEPDASDWPTPPVALAPWDDPSTTWND